MANFILGEMLVNIVIRYANDAPQMGQQDIPILPVTKVCTVYLLHTKLGLFHQEGRGDRHERA